MKNILIVVLFLFSFQFVDAFESKYWISFKDKNNTPYQIQNPNKYLSSKSIERRKKQGISIDSTDLPVNPKYVSEIKKTGATVLGTSKWMNGVIVLASDTAIVNKIRVLPFVEDVELTWEGLTSDFTKKKAIKIKKKPEDKPASDYYGRTAEQIEMLNGSKLHELGFRGKGLQIAVIDAGFLNANKLSVFDSLYIKKRILGTKDFVTPSISNVYLEHQHGTMVLSTMAGNIPYVMVGTAPEASYWLIRTEDVNTEYPIECDYLVAALEFADSAGVDIANISLGYSIFDNKSMDYTYGSLDGKSVRVTQAATIAARKGMIIVSSAGNEGNKDWGYITVPSEADSIITAGSVTFDSTKSAFSSHGPTADGRIKPTVSALGTSVSVISSKNTIEKANGTSFSSSILAGMVACLWQSLPQLNNIEIIELIKNSGSKANNPNNSVGYGIPDFYAAYKAGVGK